MEGAEKGIRIGRFGRVEVDLLPKPPRAPKGYRAWNNRSVEMIGTHSSESDLATKDLISNPEKDPRLESVRDLGFEFEKIEPSPLRLE